MRVVFVVSVLTLSMLTEKILLQPAGFFHSHPVPFQLLLCLRYTSISVNMHERTCLIHRSVCKRNTKTDRHKRNALFINVVISVKLIYTVSYIRNVIFFFHFLPGYFRVTIFCFLSVRKFITSFNRFFF